MKAKLTIGHNGHVTDIDILESEPHHLFDRAAIRAWFGWRFKEARFQNERYIVEIMEFKRGY